MEKKPVYLFDEEYKYIGIGESIPHPFGMGEDTIPYNATYAIPPEAKEGYDIVFIPATDTTQERWKYERILSEAEKKVNGETELTDGEYVEDGELVIVEQPSVLHVWNKETNTWDISTERVESYRMEIYGIISNQRDIALATGTFFEEGKLIKGREKDLVHAQAYYLGFKDGITSSVRWFYSNGATEVVDTLARMTAIYVAIGEFINETYNKEGYLKLKVSQITDPEILLAFDINTEWDAATAITLT